MEFLLHFVLVFRDLWVNFWLGRGSAFDTPEMKRLRLCNRAHYRSVGRSVGHWSRARHHTIAIRTSLEWHGVDLFHHFKLSLFCTERKCSFRLCMELRSLWYREFHFAISRKRSVGSAKLVLKKSGAGCKCRLCSPSRRLLRVYMTGRSSKLRSGGDCQFPTDRTMRTHRHIVGPQSFPEDVRALSKCHRTTAATRGSPWMVGMLRRCNGRQLVGHSS